MLNGLNFIEFMLYVGPWILFAFICLLTMLFIGVKYDFAREHIEELKAKNQYYADEPVVYSATTLCFRLR